MAEKYAKRYHVGLGNVGSYQVSARPENGLRDSTNNYFILSGTESFTADFKVTKVYLMGHEKLNADMSTTASVIAGLTGIESALLSGSWAGHPGV